MTKKSILDRVAVSVACVSIAILVSGTDACQQDYSVGGQVTAPSTGTPSATATETQSPVVTGTETPEGTNTPTPTGTPPTTTPTASPTSTAENTTNTLAASKSNLLNDLSKADGSAGDVAVSGGAAAGAGAVGGNWLGQGFSKDNAPLWSDSDGDGFSDDLEEQSGTDAQDSQSIPDHVVTSSFEARLRPSDSDLDGVSDSDEAGQGSNPKSFDSDGDGRIDGAEVLSEGSLTDPKDVYVDSDNDGLSNVYETSHNSDPNKVDSDNDGLRDDLEAVFSCNPQVIDSDGDGISDGKEYSLGSDPTVPE